MLHVVVFKLGKGGAEVSDGRGEFIGNGVGGVGIGETWQDAGGVVVGSSGGVTFALLVMAFTLAVLFGGGRVVLSGGGGGLFVFDSG